MIVVIACSLSYYHEIGYCRIPISVPDSSLTYRSYLIDNWISLHNSRKRQVYTISFKRLSLICTILYATICVLRYVLWPCIPGLIIVQKYRVQNLDVDVINRKLLIYFSLLQAFLKFFFCFAFAGMVNIKKHEIFICINHSVNLQYA